MECIQIIEWKHQSDEAKARIAGFIAEGYEVVTMSSDAYVLDGQIHRTHTVLMVHREKAIQEVRDVVSQLISEKTRTVPSRSNEETN